MDWGKPMGKFTGRKTAEASPGGGGGSGGKSAAAGTSLSGTRVVARTAVTREQGESISCPFCGGRARGLQPFCPHCGRRDRKSTRLNSSHLVISYAVFCLKKKKKT